MVIEGLSTNTTECSDLAPKNCDTCLSNSSVRILKDYFQVDEFDINNFIEETKPKLGCDTEKCVIQQVERQLPKKESNALRKDLALNYKLKGPSDSTALLSNINIDATLTLWTRSFPKFTFTPYAMMDFAKYSHPLNSIDLPKISKKYNCWACVLNTDTHYGPGQHWVCLFADFREEPVIEYFNSTGNPPPFEVREWFKKQHNKGLKTMVANHRAHQKKNTECGMYVLFYIRSRIEGRPVKFFATNTVHDKYMVEFRRHIFMKD